MSPVCVCRISSSSILGCHRCLTSPQYTSPAALPLLIIRFDWIAACQEPQASCLVNHRAQEFSVPVQHVGSTPNLRCFFLSRGPEPPEHAIKTSIWTFSSWIDSPVRWDLGALRSSGQHAQCMSEGVLTLGSGEFCVMGLCYGFKN